MRMIFHTLRPVFANGNEGPQMRMYGMYNAFKELGYDVDLVDGYSAERKSKIGKVMENLAKGVKYDFLYSESCTNPTFTSDPHRRNILDYNMDRNFLARVKKYQVPTGFYYRDVYWKFLHLDSGVQKNWKLMLTLFMYRQDLRWYKKVYDVIYLQSPEMRKYLPELDRCQVRALPPGHNVNSAIEYEYRPPLNMIYVGGVSAHYKIHKLLEAVKCIEDSRLVVCTREHEWASNAGEYRSHMCSRVEVKHVNSDGLVPLYKQADVACLFMEPSPYREFTLPIKLYEYIGYEVPIIASKGTLVGTFVEQNDIGWAIEYDDAALRELLDRLINQPAEILKMRRNVRAIKGNHSWLRRARQVASDLTEASLDADEDIYVVHKA